MPALDELAAFSLLADLTDDQIAQVAAVSHEVAFEPGTRIMSEGGQANRCWLISSGHVKLQTRFPHGASATVQTLARGDVLGWSWLVPPHSWRFDAVASEQVTAIEVDGEQLRQLAEGDPALGFAIARRLVEVLADRVHGARARLIDLYRNPRVD